MWKEWMGIVICAGALVGLAVFYIRYFRLPVCITPVLCCSGVSVFLTLAGMAGLLLPGCYIVLGLGWLALVVGMIAPGRRRREKPKALEWTVPLLFLVALCAYAAVRVNEKSFIHYDNYSHWGLLFSQMLRLDALPTAVSAPVVAFSSYPPAAACLVYFFAQFSGASEGAMMFGQAF